MKHFRCSLVRGELVKNVQSQYNSHWTRSRPFLYKLIQDVLVGTSVCFTVPSGLDLEKVSGGIFRKYPIHLVDTPGATVIQCPAVWISPSYPRYKRETFSSLAAFRGIVALGRRYRIGPRSPFLQRTVGRSVDVAHAVQRTNAVNFAGKLYRRKR